MRDLIDRFLHVVFAERALSACVRDSDGVRAERFADGDEADVVRVAPARARGSGDALLYGLQVGPD